MAFIWHGETAGEAVFCMVGDRNKSSSMLLARSAKNECRNNRFPLVTRTDRDALGFFKYVLISAISRSALTRTNRTCEP